MDEVEAMLRVLLSRGSVQAGYAASVLVLLPATLWFAHHVGWSRTRSAVAAGGAVALAIFPALTLSRRGVELGVPICKVDLIDGLAGLEAEQVLNWVVLMPAGLLFALALRQARPVILAALVLSGGAEAVQAVLGTGYCQTLDVIRNTGGAALAALLGAGVGGRFGTTIGRAGRDDRRARRTP